MPNEEKKINCHFISNTHWDREWRFSARRTQYMLGYMLDMLLDILDKYPEISGAKVAILNRNLEAGQALADEINGTAIDHHSCIVDEVASRRVKLVGNFVQLQVEFDGYIIAHMVGNSSPGDQGCDKLVDDFLNPGI